jgi:hypothetical protein
MSRIITGLGVVAPNGWSLTPFAIKMGFLGYGKIQI